MNDDQLSITPTGENPNLISFKQVIPNDELDLGGYLLSPSLVTQLRTTAPDSNELDTTTPDSNNEDNTSNIGYNGSWGNFDGTRQKTVGEAKNSVEYKSEKSSLNRSVLVDIVNGKKPAHYYKLTSSTNKSHIFQLFEVLQALSDKADDMTIHSEIRAHTKQEFDPSWIRNAIEEPLDEMDIKASTWLEQSRSDTKSRSNVSF